MAHPALEVEALEHRYGDTRAVRGISLVASPGEILGLLGPNGAGKTTALACVAGLIVPAGGRIRIAGADLATEPARAKAALGYVPQELAVYEELGAEDNLSFWARAYGLSGAALRRRVAEVLDAIGLAERSRERVARFSTGMKRRLSFGCGLVHRPRLLLLDEPTVGVDPQSRARLLDLVRSEADGGACAIVATHQLEVAEALCDRLAIIDEGKIVAEGDIEALAQQAGGRDAVTIEGRFDAERARDALGTLDGVELTSASETRVLLLAADSAARLPALLTTLSSAGTVGEVTLHRPRLEALFLSLTGRALRD